MKIVSLLMLAISTLLAQTYTFNESRYIYAIDKNISLEGSIFFSDDFMKISYTAPQQRVIEVDSTQMNIYENKKHIQSITLKDDAKMALYMSFIKKMYQMDLDALKEYFSIEKKGSTLYLTPNAMSKTIINSIKVHYNKSVIQSIYTKMQSGDEILLLIKQ